jgi:methionyl-tRNA formyltransferase
MRLLFFAKDKPFSKDAAEIIMHNFPQSRVVFGNVEEPFPQEFLTDSSEFDYIISYISPWIIPRPVLKKAKVASINFHPGPPDYPGIGCTNFAIYNREKEFGITVHHMIEKVDRGEIIMVKRFALFESDSVWTLSQRCYAYIYVAFVEVIGLLMNKQPLPVAKEQWGRNPYTRKQLNELCEITPEMDVEEVALRIKATHFPGMPGAYIKLNGNKFVFQSHEEG